MLHVAVQDVAPRALADVGATLARHIGAPVPLAFPDWLPYLTAASPELPSVIQRALGPGSPRAQTSQSRLIVCGSAMSVMSRLLTGTAPLRGRAALELIVHPFDYRETATFWKLGDPELAVMVHAVVGGTPAYRDLLREDAPESVADFDGWVIRAVLDPASPLAREGRYLLAEEPSITDRRSTTRSSPRSPRAAPAAGRSHRRSAGRTTS